MQQLPNGLKSSIHRISPKINVHVDFLIIHRCMPTNYTVQIKDALHYFSSSLRFRDYSRGPQNQRGCARLFKSSRTAPIYLFLLSEILNKSIDDICNVICVSR